jgi:hypothetical protein
MMEDYLMQLGLSPFDEHFYFPNKAKLVKLKGWPTKSNLPTYATLKEVRKRLNFK